MSDQDLVIYKNLEERAQAVELVEAGMALVEKAEQYKGVLNDTDAAVVSELRARLNGHIKRVDSERLDMTAGAREAQARVNEQFNAKLGPMKQALTKVDAVLSAHLRAKAAEEERLRREREAEERRLRDEQIAREREAERQRQENERKAREAAEASARAAEAAAKAAERGSARSEAEAAKAKKAAEEAAAAAERAAQQQRDDEAERQRQQQEADRRAQELASAPAVVSTKSIGGSYGSRSGLRDNWTYKVVDISKVPEAFLVPADERIQKSVLNALAKSQKDKATVPGIEFYNAATITSREAS